MYRTVTVLLVTVPVMMDVQPICGETQHYKKRVFVKVVKITEGRLQSTALHRRISFVIVALNMSLRMLHAEV